MRRENSIDHMDDSSSVQNDRIKVTILVPICVSLLLSLAHIFYLQENPTYYLPIVDSLEYVEIADSILNPSMKPRPFLHSPFYGWFLAGFFFYFGKNYTLIRVIQVILNTISCVLVYKLGKRCFSAVVGWYAALGFALYAPVIYFVTEIINVPFILFFTLFSLFLLIRAVEEHHWKWWLAAGLFAGLNVATRADTIVFYVLAAVMTTRKNPRFLIRSAAFTIIMLAPLLVVGSHNFFASGRFQALPANSGLAFYVGNNPDYLSTIGIRPGSAYQNLIAKPNRDGIVPDKKDYAFNQYFFRKSILFITQDTGQYAKCLLYKIRTLIGGYELPETYDLYTYRNYSPVLRMLLFYIDGFGFPFSLLFPLSIFGIALGYRRSGSQWLLRLFLLCMLIPLLGYWNSTRYRMAIIPILLLYSGVSIVWIGRQIQGREFKRVHRFALFFFVLMAASSFPYPHFSKDYNFDAEMYISAGLSSLAKGDIGAGVGLLQKGVALEPDNFYYHGQLAHAYQKKELLQEALAEYQNALRLNSQDIALHNNIATLFTAMGNEEMALHHYKIAVSLNPNFSISRHNLGAIFFKKEQYAKAVENLRVAVTFGPDFSASHFLLGMGLCKLGKVEEGRKEIAEAVRLDPGVVRFQGFKNNSISTR